MREPHDEPAAASAAVRALAGLMLAGSAEAVLTRTCDATKVVIPGADDVSVTVIEQDNARTVASSGELASRADAAQYSFGDGPCLEAARLGAPVLVSDLSTDSRWPSYVAAALDVGVRGSLSVPLEIAADVAGALNIYTTRTSALDQEVVDVASDLARYAGAVVTATGEFRRATSVAEQMQRAMESRAVIEQAKGVLMAQRRCGADEAFEVLVRLSQESHRKLREIAELIVEQIAKP